MVGTICLIVIAAAQSQDTGNPSAGISKAARDTFQLTDGVIVDSNRNALYLMNPRGGIDALRLDSGKLLWHTEAAAKPLLIHRELLIAQAESPTAAGHLRIIVLDVQNSGGKPREFSVPVPAGRHVGIDDGLGKSFRASASAEGHDVLVIWESHDHIVSGTAPQPNEDSRNRKSSGVVRIRLDSGRVEKMIGELPSGDPLPDLALFKDRITIRGRSADGQYILASRAAMPDDQVADAFIWTIYSIGTGERFAEFSHPSPAGRFGVAGSTVLQVLNRAQRNLGGKWIEEPPRIRAVAAENGKRLWEQQVRDTAYRGPYPPSQVAP